MMNRALFVAILVVVGSLAIAGCASKPRQPSAGDSPGSEPLPDAIQPLPDGIEPLPDAIHDEVDVLAGGGWLLPNAQECLLPRACFDYPFTLPRAAIVEASVSWTSAADTIQLALRQGDQELRFETSDIGAVDLAFEDELPPGDYVLRAHSSRMVNDRFVLDVWFREVPSFTIVPCGEAGWVSLTGGLCAAVVGPPGLRDREVSLAVHPTDPQTVLITWRQGEFYQTPRIWAGFTSNGGDTWTITRLENRGLDPVSGDSPSGHSYDSIAEFGPDGTGYVMYGGDRTDIAEGTQPLDRLTLARTRDGVEWSYTTIYEFPIGVAAPDYPDFAVAPDGQHMYVVTQSFEVLAVGTPQGIWLWSSDDAGLTWSVPRIIIPYTKSVQHYIPRVTAGADGLVVVATNLFTGVGTPVSAYVTVSRDNGASFDSPRKILDYAANGYGGEAGLINDPIALDGATISLAYADGTRLVGFRSSDAGRTWSSASELGSLPGPAIYASAASAPDGRVVAMARYGTSDLFGIGFVRWSDGAVVTTLHEAPMNGTWELGDDYGAIGVASDGAAWVAWGMPDGKEREDIWVTRSA